ncbi:MAG: hypothetical protein LUD84_07040 [Clostridiales bacterium]|nr:hypothetical protein [Clostridiales bacterium]
MFPLHHIGWDGIRQETRRKRGKIHRELFAPLGEAQIFGTPKTVEKGLFPLERSCFLVKGGKRKGKEKEKGSFPSVLQGGLVQNLVEKVQIFFGQKKSTPGPLDGKKYTDGRRKEKIFLVLFSRLSTD